jgi:hypothetical protein
MFNGLIEHPLLLAVAIIALGLANSGLGLAVLHAESRQRFFERAGASRASSPRSPGTQFLRPLVTGALIATLVVFLDPTTREALGGGWLVVQLTTLVLNLDALLRARVLSAPGVAEGRVVLSRGYEHRASAARLIASALFVEVVALLFESLAFAAGGGFLAATAIGWYRRARQASKTNER